ncbi:flagellar biosynthetic protein FliR [Neptunomonas japonica]|uniref:Flagellar biosynthetic protein FliR n=1 Tax=Neptunomonas japonica JAMM 1380 TaxID=1441457 RepID=A0A7R6SVF3_9GAMM|nr:flagellar biosynthetic protein FliR [Neptunomonas japonica]BBB28680.1 flagellar biosynthetic protein FliR [Neptunomonas japonica JAMM 1380]
MLDIGLLQLEQWTSTFLFPFFRIASFLMAMPMIGTQLVPMRIRLGLALAMTAVLLPVLPVPPVADGLSFQTYILIAQQILIGAILGFTLHIMFQIFAVGGQLIANQMGLGFASMTDPVNGVSVVVLGQFYLMLTMLMFLAMNGHLVMINVVTQSFDILPVAVVDFSAIKFMDVALAGTWMFSGALLMSLPAVTSLLVINLSFGIMTKAAPQLNIFAIGFPFTMVMGLLITWVSLSGFLGQFELIADHALGVISQLIEVTDG